METTDETPVEAANAAEPENQAKVLELDQFLMTVPALENRRVRVPFVRLPAGAQLVIQHPPITVYCTADPCRRRGFFDPPESVTVAWRPPYGQTLRYFVTFVCRNCQKSTKTFALQYFGLDWQEDGPHLVTFRKFGESPRFGEPRLNSVREVLDDEIEFFDRGYRAETEGLGIGAFAYYRRFVESHKNKIIDEVRKVAVAQGAKPEVLEAIDRARQSVSFEKAVDAIKDAIPDSLRYQGGHNPLTLLHTALSQGLHSDDDVECLELAHDIRLVLTDLADRTTAALKRSDELGGAVKRLLDKGARGKRP